MKMNITTKWRYVKTYKQSLLLAIVNVTPRVVIRTHAASEIICNKKKRFF